MQLEEKLLPPCKLANKLLHEKYQMWKMSDGSSFYLQVIILFVSSHTCIPPHPPTSAHQAKDFLFFSKKTTLKLFSLRKFT